jgi:PAS domain-containing protein
MDCGLGRFILADFMPHGFCMRWQPEVLWLHVISDGLIVLAYASIPFLLLVVARRRKDIPFHWMLPAFSAFILACGATHLMSIVTIWNPLYQLEGIFKALTAVASLVTAFGLYRLLPDILKMPSTVQLHNAHASLTLSNRELSQLADELEVSNRALQQSAAANESSEAQFRQLADSMPHIVWTAQPNGLVDYYNERWYSFTGLRPQPCWRQ